MPAVHVRDVPAEVLTAIKERAARKGHSMQKELLAILSEAALGAAPGRELPPLELHTVSIGDSVSTSREDMYGPDGR